MLKGSAAALKTSRPRQQRADAAPARGACTLVDRAGPAGEVRVAAKVLLDQIEGNRHSLIRSIAMTAHNHYETTWRATPPELRICDKALPPNAADARICSYECTFCADCVDSKLHNVCPNCGGGFERRPIRPATERRPGVCVTKQLPSDKRVHLKYSVEDVAAHSARLRDIPPQERCLRRVGTAVSHHFARASGSRGGHGPNAPFPPDDQQ